MAKLNFEIFDKGDKKEILKDLGKYGIEKLPYLIVKWGKRLRIFSGTMDKNSILTLFREINVDSIGLYFAAPTESDGLRLSLDAVHLLKGEIKDCMLEVNDEQTEQWFRGKDIILDEEQKRETEKFESKFVILRNNEDFIGVGKKSFYGITNFMPKERRIKK